MDKALADLIKISNATGRDTALVQGGGGNTSVKTADGKYMYVKASGTALKDMSAARGWRRLKMDAVMKVVGDKELAGFDVATRETEVVNRLLLACDDKVKTGARPSVESHLHALLDKCVIHLHPLVIGAFVSARNGKKEIEKLFTDEKYPPLWVPYADPGFLLAKKVSFLIDRYEADYGRKPSVMILQKHGLFVTAKTADAALALVKKTIKRCSANLLQLSAERSYRPAEPDVTAAKLAIRKAVFDAAGQYLPVTWFGARRCRRRISRTQRRRTAS
jgi:rhamnose utilization protein RhaD (predicted bifunctional aldolase and dehydrogenase)